MKSIALQVSLLVTSPSLAFAQGFVDIGDLGGGLTEVRAINSLGQIVGVSSVANGDSHAFRYRTGS